MDNRLKKLIKDIYTLLPITPEDAALFVIALRNGIDIHKNYRLKVLNQQELKEWIEENILDNTVWGAFEKVRRQFKKLEKELLEELFKFNFKDWGLNA